jgi:hypothetical protein
VAHKIEKYRLKVKAALSARGLGSYMNDTKWRELFAEIDNLPFPPPYQRKDILSDDPDPKIFDEDVRYHGDWSEEIYPFFTIEWLRIRPRYLKHVGRLVPYEIIDCQAELEQLLKRLGQAYEKFNDSIWIYGYR